jgi:hypothetical protein
LNLGGSFNLGLESMVHDNIYAFMEAGVHQDFTSLVKNRRGFFKFLNYGISFGLNFKI